MARKPVMGPPPPPKKRGRKPLYPPGTSRAERGRIRAAKMAADAAAGVKPGFARATQVKVGLLDAAIGAEVPQDQIAYQPTEAHRTAVAAMALAGTRQDLIAEVIGTSFHNLNAHYQNELNLAEPRALSRVARTLYAVATDTKHPGCVTAGMFIMRTRGKWADPNTQQMLEQIEALKAELEATAERMARLTKLRSVA